MVKVPETTSSPPFRVTRASHLVYTVRDLSRSRDFYTEVLGLVVTDEDQEALYLRGVEERSHHSLVLKRTDGAPSCVRTGLRTFDDEDLDRARAPHSCIAYAARSWNHPAISSRVTSCKAEPNAA